MTKSALSKAYERFRVLLIETRKNRGLTQADLATRLGKPQSFISKYERGERRLDVIEYLQVMGALGVDAIEMMRKIEGEAENGAKYPRKMANHRS